jgi:outer membrane murein-binding lipoprotein Lpp
MPWYALLIVGLISLAIVIGGCAYVARKGWRLAKRGSQVSKRVAPLADDLRRKADELSARAEGLSAKSEQLTETIARLQASMARLQVVSDAVTEGLEPFLLLTGWLSGDRGWNDWRRWSRRHR